MTRQTVSEAVVYTNRPDDQYPIAFDMPEPAYPEVKSLPIAEAAATGLGLEGSLFNNGMRSDVITVADDAWGSHQSSDKPH